MCLGVLFQEEICLIKGGSNKIGLGKIYKKSIWDGVLVNENEW